MSTATLILTPWAAQALSDGDERAVTRRAVELHCRVRAGSSNKAWGIRVTSWTQIPDQGALYEVNHHRKYGDLATLIHAALDDYERRFVFSPDELAAIRRQTEAA